MGPLILFVLGFVCGVALALFLVRRGNDRQRELTAMGLAEAKKAVEAFECEQG